jgi:hypothetical protein
VCSPQSIGKAYGSPTWRAKITVRRMFAKSGFQARAKMAPKAVEILKRLQPDYDDKVGRSSERVVHYLDGINMLSNYDKHFELPTVVAGIIQLRIT